MTELATVTGTVQAAGTSDQATVPGTAGLATVTGATGLVGSHVVAQLLQQDIRVRILIRNARRLENLKHTLSRFELLDKFDLIEIREVSLLNPIRLRKALQGTDTVYHCAATVSFEDGAEEQLIIGNMEITAHMVDAALAARVRLFVHVSSVAALGKTVLDCQTHYLKASVSEEDHIATTKDLSAYAVSKFYAENQIRRAQALGLSTIRINPSIILGEGEWDRSSGQIIAQAVRGGWMYTEGVKGYVDVRDVARAMVLLAREERAIGERFLLSAANISFRELFGIVARTIHKPQPFVMVRGKALQKIAGLESVMRKVVGGTPKLTEEVRKSAVSRVYYNGEKIERWTEFRYTPIEETVTRIAEAYIKETKK